MTDPTAGGQPPVPPSSPPVSQTPPVPPAGSDDNRRGSRAWIEAHYGRTAAFGDRILPGIIDGAVTFAAAFVPVVLGIICIIAGLPDTYDCSGFYYEDTCDVPGSGSGALIALGVFLIFLSVVAGLVVVAYNRVWRVTRTGQSIGKRITGLKVIDAQTGEHPRLGPAALRELVSQVAGVISWIWMLIDDDDRTLADIVGSTHVIHADKADKHP